MFCYDYVQLVVVAALALQQEQQERAHSGADGHDRLAHLSGAGHGGVPSDGAPRAAPPHSPRAGDLQRLPATGHTGRTAIQQRTHSHAGRERREIGFLHPEFAR